jgi:glycine/D-amino acid oxidase-like deaminating enzyme
VTLLERDQLAGHASGAAAGELSPHSTAAAPSESALRSSEMLPELVRPIEKGSGISFEYRVQRGIQPALNADEATALRSSGDRWVDAAEALREEPSLARPGGATPATASRGPQWTT